MSYNDFIIKNNNTATRMDHLNRKSKSTAITGEKHHLVKLFEVLSHYSNLIQRKAFAWLDCLLIFFYFYLQLFFDFELN